MKIVNDEIKKRFMNTTSIALSRSLRTGFMHPRIKPFTSVTKFVGEAYTIRAPERDASTIYEAVSHAPAGSVMVIDRGHDSFFAAIDEQVVLIAKARGLAGIVIDGCIGNSGTIKNLKFPVFATGISPAGCTCLGISGEIGSMIRCGDIVVHPNQIVFADDDGVIVFNHDESILKSAEKEIVLLKNLREKVNKGCDELNYMGIDVAAFRRAQPSDIIAKVKKRCAINEVKKGDF